MKETTHHARMAEEVFDTHAHLYDDRYEQEGISPSDVLRRASEAGITRILIPADSIESSKAAIDYVKAHDGESGVSLFCSVGIHPHEASSYDPAADRQLRLWLGDREALKIKALGEIGLDYYYDLSPRDIQRDVFRRQLDMAYDLDIPVIIHNRESTGDLIDILREFTSRGRLRNNPGVIHCCSTSPEIAKQLVGMGFYIGVDGPLTYKNNKNTPAICEAVPLSRIVIETDSPYLTPEPNRGRINEPEHVTFVADRLAGIKGITVDEAVRATTANGLAMYEI